MIGYASGDGLTEGLATPGSVWGCSHRALVDIGPVRNGLGQDARDWTTLPAYRERIERARSDSNCLTKTKGQKNEVAK